jgi:hypothetical protein
MTPFEIQQRQQQRIEQQDQITQDLYLDGASDAAMGESPQSKDPAYLDGYLSRLRELILNDTRTLQIRWLSPAYLSGNFDSGEEF